MGSDYGNVDLIRVDSPKDVQRLKLIAEELDNDTGREVFLSFYNGLETISQVSEKLGITMQLVSYHVEKLTLAGLLKEKQPAWTSVKGRTMKRYEPSKAALLVVPSVDYLKQNRESAKTMASSLKNMKARLLLEVAAPAAVFLAVLFSTRIPTILRLLAASLGRIAIHTLPANSGNLNTSSTLTTGLAASQANQSVVSVASRLDSISGQLSSINAKLGAISNQTSIMMNLTLLLLGLLLALLVWVTIKRLKR